MDVKLFCVCAYINMLLTACVYERMIVFDNVSNLCVSVCPAAPSGVSTING